MKTLLLLAILAAFPAAAAQVACGGVGSDQRHAMESVADRANLALEVFVSPGGEYLADVDVSLRGPEEVSVHTEGPICYLRVAPGRYRVQATFRGITRSAEVTVAASARKPVRVALAFPKSVGDRQNDAASPEEKAQAAQRP